MRTSLIRFWGTGSVLLLASACNAIFGVHEGDDGGTTTGGSGTGGTGGTGVTTSTGTTTSTSEAGTGGSNEGGTGGVHEGGTGGSNEGGVSEGGVSEAGTEGGAPCTAGTAQCANGVLTLCDSTGHTETPVTCAAESLCDALNLRCTAFGRLGVGDQRACVLEDDQSVWCWGGNYGSPLEGVGSLLLTDEHRMFPSPVQIGTLKGRQISVGYDHQCVLHDDGTVGCWGNGDYGALGASIAQQNGMVDPVPNLAGVVEISVSDGTCSCARLASGEVDCWGIQDSGCLGTTNTGTGPAPATKVQLPATAVQIAAGDGYFAPTCARLSTGRVACWSSVLPPTEIPGITGAVDIGVGWNLVVVRTQTGLFWSTQLPPAADAGTPDGGPGPTTWMPAAAYTGFSNVAQMSSAAAFCAVQTDGTVLCASNQGGQGNPGAPSAVQVPGTSLPVEVGVGWGNNYGAAIQCVRTAGTSIKGNVYCWGDDYDGALGIGGPEYRTTKLDVASFSTHAITSMNAGTTAVGVVLDDGSAWFWGASGAYQDMIPLQTTPSVLLNLSKNNVALHSNDYYGWGYATKTASAPVGLFNGGTAQSSQDPIRLQTYTSTSYVDARYGYIDFGLLPSGTVVAFSDNQGGMVNANDCGVFGNGGTSVVNGPQAVPNVTATALAYQDNGDCGTHVCVITTTGTVQCWGRNYDGESGFPGSPPSSEPPFPAVYSATTVSILGAQAITSLAAGVDFTCATDGPTGSGQVYCWGNNSFGQLGIDFMYNYATATPAAVTGIMNAGGTSAAVGVSAFGSFACAWLADKTVWCWGDNEFGQLGNGNFDPQQSPVQVTGISDAVSVAVGPDFACALRTGGAVSCWGSSYWGQGGAGLRGDSYATPIAVTGLP
jgi:alpha-tubulin suppressor-like RCC1 family protein